MQWRQPRYGALMRNILRDFYEINIIGYISGPENCVKIISSTFSVLRPLYFAELFSKDYLLRLAYFDLCTFDILSNMDFLLVEKFVLVEVKFGQKVEVKFRSK